MKRTEIKVGKLIELLVGKETICTDQLQALIEKAQGQVVTREMAKAILQPKRTDILDVEAVINALATKGLKIELTPEEKAIFEYVPFSEETLKMAAGRQWRGKRAILWWAPPERYGITMLKLRDVFGTSRDVQPCIYSNEWWLKEKFAKETLREGWHLILAELPDETKDLNYEDQKALLTKEEELLTPVETMYLPLVNYLVNDGERLMENCWSRTDTLGSDGDVVSLGYFDSDGLYVRYWPPASRHSGIGLLLARKFD